MPKGLLALWKSGASDKNAETKLQDDINNLLIWTNKQIFLRRKQNLLYFPEIR